MRNVSTIEILARRALQRPCGVECVEWAVGLLEQGRESKSVRVLAGMTPPLNHFEIADLRERVLFETQPPELQIEDPITEFVREIIQAALKSDLALHTAFALITDLAIELGYPSELQPFYNLFNAWDDLQYRAEQWYWNGATRENIDSLMREEARRFVAATSR